MVPSLWMKISRFREVNSPKGSHKIWTKVWLTGGPVLQMEGTSTVEPASSRSWKNGGGRMRVPHFWVQLRSTHISLPTAFEAGLNYLNLTLIWLWKCSCLLIQLSIWWINLLSISSSPLVYGSAGYLIASWPENQCIRKEKRRKT